MAIEAKTALIQTGESLAVPDKIYDLPVEFIGFENLSSDHVKLNEDRYVRALIPDFDYRPSEYQAEEAICFSEAGQPVIAIVKGRRFIKSRITGILPIISIVNLSIEPEKVILVSSETRPLENNTVYWPGYDLGGHEKNLKLGLETMLVEKRGEEFVISFPEGDTV